MSLTAHKTYGPKGIGALYVRRTPQVRLECQMHGGGHERGLRSGTLATHQIVGMGTAFRIAGERMATEVPRLRALRDRFWSKLKDLPGVILNGDPERRIARAAGAGLGQRHRRQFDPHHRRPLQYHQRNRLGGGLPAQKNRGLPGRTAGGLNAAP
jgi:cysteine sulfinate desulfinase/cysteine desulfurase-like protein